MYFNLFSNLADFLENYKYIQIKEWVCMNYLNQACSNDSGCKNNNCNCNVNCNVNENKYNCSIQQREPTANFHF